MGHLLIIRAHIMKQHSAVRVVSPVTLSFLLVMLGHVTTVSAGAQAVAAPDTVVLRTGGRIAGRIVESNPPNFVVIARTSGATETLMWSDVRRVVRMTPANRAGSAAVAPTTPAARSDAASTVAAASPPRSDAVPNDVAPPPPRRPAVTNTAATAATTPSADKAGSDGTASTTSVFTKGFTSVYFASAGRFGYGGTLGRYVALRASASTFTGLLGYICGFGCTAVTTSDRNPRDERIGSNMLAIGPMIPISRRVLAFAEVGLEQVLVSAQFDAGRRSYGSAYGAVFGGGVHVQASPRMVLTAGYSTGDQFFAGVGWR